jgi:hypothetical protein
MYQNWSNNSQFYPNYDENSSNSTPAFSSTISTNLTNLPTYFTMQKMPLSSSTKLSYTTFQLELLESIYETMKYPNSVQKTLVAKYVGITRDQVKIWFQNRRRRDVKAANGDIVALERTASIKRARSSSFDEDESSTSDKENQDQQQQAKKPHNERIREKVYIETVLKELKSNENAPSRLTKKVKEATDNKLSLASKKEELNESVINNSHLVTTAAQISPISISCPNESLNKYEVNQSSSLLMITPSNSSSSSGSSSSSEDDAQNSIAYNQYNSYPYNHQFTTYKQCYSAVDYFQNQNASSTKNYPKIHNQMNYNSTNNVTNYYNTNNYFNSTTYQSIPFTYANYQTSDYSHNNYQYGFFNPTQAATSLLNTTSLSNNQLNYNYSNYDLSLHTSANPQTTVPTNYNQQQISESLQATSNESSDDILNIPVTLTPSLL